VNKNNNGNVDKKDMIMINNKMSCELYKSDSKNSDKVINNNNKEVNKGK
jgi:hypothetical protein